MHKHLSADRSSRDLRVAGALAMALFAASPAGAQRGGRDNDAGADYPCRVVRRDGTQEVGDLTFRWNQYQCAEADPTDAGRGGGGAVAELLSVAQGEEERGLHTIDRIEHEGRAVFRADDIDVTNEWVAGLAYGPAYGGMSLRLPEDDWRFVVAGPSEVIAVRRGADRDIVGRVRAYAYRAGDGESVRTLEEKDRTAERLFRAVDRDRFGRVSSEDDGEGVFISGVTAATLRMFGEESQTGAAIHLDVRVAQSGPFLPAFEVMARGEHLTQVLAEAEVIFSTLEFTTNGVVEPLPEPEPAVDLPPRDSGGGRGGAGGGGAGGARGTFGAGAGALAILSQLEDVEDETYLPDGRYVNERLGIEMRSKLPKEWVYVRVNDHGFMVLRKPTGGPFELVALMFTVMEGEVDPKAVPDDGPAWIIDRYGAELRSAAPDGEYKVKTTSFGRHKAQQVLFQQETARGKGPVHLLAVIEELGRSHVIRAVSYGSGSRAEDAMDEGRKWLKSLRISK